MKAYLDNNATTRMAPEVLDAMMPFLTERFGNPSSFHSFGSGVMEEIEAAREEVAALIGAGPEEIVFTSGGTESDNTALLGGCAINPLKPGLVTSKVEHPAVMVTAKRLRDGGAPVEFAEVRGDGTLDMDSLGALVSGRTGLVSLMMANNETGVIFPIAEAARMAHEAGALLHTDAVQAVGKVSVNVKSMGIDLLSLSAHKFHGPKGIGALYIGDGIDLPPLIIGGHQENGRRGGTYNAPGIIGLGAAARLAREELSGETDLTGEMLRRMEKSILDSCPGSRIAGGKAPRLPNTSTVLFRGVESEAVMTLLDIEGICVSSGSACSTGDESPSHVLTAMGIDPREANTAIRFSISRYTSQREVDHLLEVLPPIIDRLRKISPYAD
ncbi:MAG: aminotransferase class V-fold PLP-dependent enzyme [Candidatus Fermentibacteraceae bacterium]|nr:aminotransferase class V-fold PLP-dependent enzyme [Candidatus Fermentibacteraceae bacterium]MBN2608240.1 aminotransferase class V-fold PLP-dependent enzyme [Candidatus Fermentibacteraceae bacterium]